MLKNRSRTWKRYTKKLTTEKIDLTMELGGQVLEDTKVGKIT